MKKRMYMVLIELLCMTFLIGCSNVPEGFQSYIKREFDAQETTFIGLSDGFFDIDGFLIGQTGLVVGSSNGESSEALWEYLYKTEDYDYYCYFTFISFRSEDVKGFTYYIQDCLVNIIRFEDQDKALKSFNDFTNNLYGYTRVQAQDLPKEQYNLDGYNGYLAVEARGKKYLTVLNGDTIITIKTLSEISDSSKMEAIANELKILNPCSINYDDSVTRKIEGAIEKAVERDLEEQRRHMSEEEQRHRNEVDEVIDIIDGYY